MKELVIKNTFPYAGEMTEIDILVIPETESNPEGSVKAFIDEAVKDNLKRQDVTEEKIKEIFDLRNEDNDTDFRDALEGYNIQYMTFENSVYLPETGSSEAMRFDIVTPTLPDGTVVELMIKEAK